MSELPSQVKEALLRLATDERIKELELMLREQIKLASGEEDDEIPEPSENITIPAIENWEEGTEDLKNKTLEELWQIIGLGETQRIPGLNKKIDVDGTRNPWDKRDAEWLETQRY
jgi:hypothetical protein